MRQTDTRGTQPVEYALYEAIKAGDTMAFAKYYESSVNRLVHLVQRITKCEEEAKNIAHDTFARLWQQHESIDPAQSLDGFISTVATRLALDYLRRKHVAARYRDEALFTQSIEEVATDERMLANEMRSGVERVIAGMPEQRRKVYTLSREEGLSYSEIAERLGISPGTVHSHMKVALREIRDVLGVIFVWFSTVGNTFNQFH